MWIMEPTKAAARTGVEQAPPSHSSFSFSVVCSGVFSSLGSLDLFFLDSWWKSSFRETT